MKRKVWRLYRKWVIHPSEENFEALEEYVRGGYDTDFKKAINGYTRGIVIHRFEKIMRKVAREEGYDKAHKDRRPFLGRHPKGL